MYNLNIKIQNAGSRSEVAQVLAKLATLIQIGSERGSIVGSEVTDGGTSTGRWNMQRTGSGIVPELATNQLELPPPAAELVGVNGKSPL